MWREKKAHALRWRGKEGPNCAIRTEKRNRKKSSKVDLNYPQSTTTVNVHVLKLKRGLRANRRAAHVVNFEPFTGEVLSELLEAALGGAFLVAVTTPQVVDEMVEANPQPP